MSVEKQDKILTCKECGDEFIFSIREQDFYVQKGFENDPARCTNCRQTRKQGGGRSNFNAMVAPGNYNNRNQGNFNNPGNFNPQYRPNNGNFNGYNNNGNNGGYNSSSSGNGYNSNGNYNNRGNFRPNNGNFGGYNNNGNSNYNRPSYGNSGNNSNYGNGGNYNSRPNNGNFGGYNRSGSGGNFGNSSYGGMNNFQEQARRMYPITCANCGIDTEVPFPPRQGVPVFCRTCYNMQKGR